jgi:hypothetical protein
MNNYWKKFFTVGGTGLPAWVKEAGYPGPAWKGCATSQYQLFSLVPKLCLGTS